MSVDLNTITKRLSVDLLRASFPMTLPHTASELTRVFFHYATFPFALYWASLELAFGREGVAHG